MALEWPVEAGADTGPRLGRREDSYRRATLECQSREEPRNSSEQRKRVGSGCQRPLDRKET